jgi:hypothetical protein
MSGDSLSSRFAVDRFVAYSSGVDSRDVVFDVSAFGRPKLNGPMTPTRDHRRISGWNFQFSLSAHTSSSESSRRFCTK